MSSGVCIPMKPKILRHTQFRKLAPPKEAKTTSFIELGLIELGGGGGGVSLGSMDIGYRGLYCLRHLLYGYMYCTTRTPMVLVYKAYIRPCGISLIHSRTPLRSHMPGNWAPDASRICWKYGEL